MSDFNRSPQAHLTGGYSENRLTGERRDSWGTRCAECKTGFSADDPAYAERMWWEHVRDEHPTAYAAFLQQGIVP